MVSSHQRFQQRLYDILQSLLPQFTKGISEYEIITLLKNPPYALFNDKALRNSLVLFQTHFILFHTLYLLRNEWRTQGIGELNIVTTCIVLTPIIEKKAKTLETLDPLAQYYLDWNQLNKTSEGDVNALLDSFWDQMIGNTPKYHQTNELEAAFTVLEFTDEHKQYNGEYIDIDSLSIEQLKQQYRKLQHRYHPDKGGSLQKTQALQHAYEILSGYISTTGAKG